MKIPNICIYIPGVHSRTVFFPRYSLPLFKKLWNPRMTDPTDMVREIPFPKRTNTPNFRFRDVPSLEIEKDFWRNFFAAGEDFFDAAYPGDSFEQAFEKLLIEMADGKFEFEEQEPDVVVPEEIAHLNEKLSPELAKQLVRYGFKSARAIAEATLAELMEVESMTAPVAAALRDSAAQETEVVVTDSQE